MLDGYFKCSCVDLVLVCVLLCDELLLIFGDDLCSMIGCKVFNVVLLWV